MLKFWVKFLFCKHYFRLLNIFMRKGKDPDADPGFRLLDPDLGDSKIADPTNLDPVPDPDPQR
jgi:hypothetical protein